MRGRRLECDLLPREQQRRGGRHHPGGGHLPAPGAGEVSTYPLSFCRFQVITTRSSLTPVAAASVPPPPQTGSQLKALEVLEEGLVEGLDQTMCSDLEELLIKYLEGEGEKQN